MGIQKISHRKSGVSSCHHHIPSSLKGETETKGKEDNPVLGADSGDDLDGCDFKEIGCELGMVEGQLCSIPYELFDLLDLRGILSIDTWNSCLTEEERFFLSAYLPDMDQQTFWLTMKELFSGSDMYFGNPMDIFFKRLKGGFYLPNITCLRESLQFLERRRHYHALRSYQDKMAQMFIDMRRLWDKCDVSVDIEGRLCMWRTRRKRGDANLLDLNMVPNDGCQLNEEVNSDAIMSHLPKRMKTWENDKVKNIVARPSAKGVNIVASNCSAKGILKFKTSGNAIHHHDQKMVLDERPEQYRSVPKGLLKVVPKVPSVQPELSKVFSRRLRTEDCKVPYSPASACLGNAGFIGSPYLWHKVAGNKMNPEKLQCLLNCQDGTLSSSRYLQNSGEDISSEVDIARLGKHKLFGHDDGGAVGSNTYNLGGHSLWQNFDVGKKGLPERSLELYPFADQYREGETERHTRIMQKEGIAILPSGRQENFVASPNRNKNPSDYNVENSDTPGKPSVSERLKFDLTLPLTYKRRKSHAKNSSDFTSSLVTGNALRSGTPKESNQHMGENVKALKIKFMDWENTPLNRES